MAFPTAGDVGQQFAVPNTLGELTFDTFGQHHDKAANHLQVAQLFCRNVDKQILATRIIFRNTLCEVAHGGGKFAVRPAELLEKKAREHRVWLRHSNRVHEPLVMHKHILTSPHSRDTAEITNVNCRSRGHWWTTECNRAGSTKIVNSR